jgi:hypothetical protein
MDALRLEYDRFGPWVIRVSRDDPPPLLFMPHLSRSDDPLLALKIPRHIERRDARPGMDLYDFLICLYADDLVILQRVERDVRSWACRYRDVRQLRVTRNLLRGIIHLGLPGQSFDLPYNTVSDAEMLGMVAMIRERYERPGAGPEPPQEPVIPDGTLSFYFDRLRASERRVHPERRLLAVQGTMKVAAQGSGLRRWALRAAGKRLLESMHSSDGHELMIRGRGQPYAYRWESVYGSDAWYIPLAGIREAGWREDAGNGAVELSIRTAAGLSHHVFASDNPSVAAYEAYLSGLVAAASQQEEAA